MNLPSRFVLVRWIVLDLERDAPEPTTTQDGDEDHEITAPDPDLAQADLATPPETGAPEKSHMLSIKQRFESKGYCAIVGG